MGDLAGEALMLYTKLVAYQQSRIGQQDEESQKHVHQQRQNITALILQFLCVCPPQSRFKYREFTKIISDSAKIHTFEPKKAIQAFLCLEDYIILLYLTPWKTEYHNIKKYGGHYQSKIASQIKGAEVILSLVGFTDLTTGLLILSHHTKQDVLQYIAFECLVASAECLIISQVWRNIDRNKVCITDVVQIRLKHSGNAEGIISVIESKYGAVKCDMLEESDSLDRKSHGVRRNLAKTRDSASFRDKLQEHMKKAEKMERSTTNDIPYMDEDIKDIERKPENFEDHILASLQLVGDKESPPAPCVNVNSSNLRPSQEWSFVREGLEKNYGKHYFEGPREDILKQQEPHLVKESPYVQVAAEPRYENVTAKGPPPIRGGKITKVVSPIPPSVYAGGHSKSQTIDSAYQSASPGMLYHPALDDPMVKRGPAKSDIIVVKGSVPINSETQKPQTAPLLRKLPDMSTASRTFPGSQKQDSVPMHLENIRKYHKGTPSSMPIQKEQSPEKSDFRHSYNANSQANQVVHPQVVSGTRTNYSMENMGASSIKEHSRTHIPKSLNFPPSGSTSSSIVNQTKVGNTIVNRVPVLHNTNKSTEWHCTYCTFLNTTTDMVCAMCSKTRDMTEVDCPTAGEVLKVCEKCTLENSSSSSVCKACGYELKGVQTVI